MKAFLSVFSVILVVSLLLTLGLYFLRRCWGDTERGRERLHPSIFSFFTTLYAFFLGFAIVTLWSAYLTAEANVSREADSLLSAFRVSQGLANSQAFRRAVADYVKAVVDMEWKSMANQSAMSGQASRRLERVWDQYLRMKPENKADNDLYISISSYLSEASRQRSSRAILLRGNLYPPVWVIIVFGFITVLYGLFFNHMEQNVVRIVFDLMVLFMVLSCIYFIYDIDTPFSGYIVVQPDIFKHVSARMAPLL